MKPVLKLGQRELDLVTEYTGHMYDQLLGVYYARARMYDAVDRRFMAVDPLEGFTTDTQTLNAYIYVLDNPLFWIDPDGEAWAEGTDSGRSSKKSGSALKNNTTALTPVVNQPTTPKPPTWGTSGSTPMKNNVFNLPKPNTTVNTPKPSAATPAYRPTTSGTPTPKPASKPSGTPPSYAAASGLYPAQRESDNRSTYPLVPLTQLPGSSYNKRLGYDSAETDSSWRSFWGNTASFFVGVGQGFTDGFLYEVPSNIANAINAEPIPFPIANQTGKVIGNLGSVLAGGVIFVGSASGGMLLALPSGGTVLVPAVAVTAYGGTVIISGGAQATKNAAILYVELTSENSSGSGNNNEGTGNISDVTEITATADTRKFSEYIFKDGAAPGKDVVFENLGYTAGDSQMLANLYTNQAAAKYASGNYTLGKLDSFRQRINIEIELGGIGSATGRTSFIQSGWMIRPDGTITLNTPFSGFTR